MATKSTKTETAAADEVVVGADASAPTPEDASVAEFASIPEPPQAQQAPPAPAPEPQMPPSKPLQFVDGVQTVDPHGGNRPAQTPQTSAEALGFTPPPVTVGAPVVVGQGQRGPRPEPRRNVRLNRNIEEMTIVSGSGIDPATGRPGKTTSQRYDFTAGHEYNVPISVAIELDRVGAIYSTGNPTAPQFVQ